jgi:hypothetical protein
MSKPRLFLHIGHPKTGTTGIQTFLLANRLRLKDAGLLYPETGLHDSAHRLISPSYYALRFAEDRSAAVRERLICEIRESGCPVIVVSCESFWLDNPRSFAPFMDLADVTVVYYLRRQDRLAESRFAQHIRSFLNLELRRPDLAGLPDLPPTDYGRTLRLFAGLFGRDRLIVRPFEHGALHQDDPALDFLHAIGFPLPAGLAPSPSPNASLKRPYLAFKRHCNALPLLEAEHLRLNRNLTALSRQDPGPSLGSILPPEQQLLIFDRHRDLNAAVARDFLNRPDGVLFNEPPPHPAGPWEPLLPLAPDAQRAVYDALSPENRDCIAFLWRSVRLAMPGDPLLPDLPDDNPVALSRLADRRQTDQLRRRVAVLEAHAAPPPNPGAPS